MDLRGEVMQYAKKKSEKQGPASLSYIPSVFFLVENKQKMMKKSEGNFQFFKIFYGKKHETHLFKFALFMGEMYGIYISHLLSCRETYECKNYA